MASPQSDGRTTPEPAKSLEYGTDVKTYEEDGVQKTAVLTGEGESLFAIDAKLERALVWKFDLRILPVLAVMYLFNSLDKSNLGNAKTAGLEKDLGLTGDQYNIMLSVFFGGCLPSPDAAVLSLTGSQSPMCSQPPFSAS